MKTVSVKDKCVFAICMILHVWSIISSGNYMERWSLYQNSAEKGKSVKGTDLTTRITIQWYINDKYLLVVFLAYNHTTSNSVTLDCFHHMCILLSFHLHHTCIKYCCFLWFAIDMSCWSPYRHTKIYATFLACIRYHGNKQNLFVSVVQKVQYLWLTYMEFYQVCTMENKYTKTFPQ